MYPKRLRNQWDSDKNLKKKELRQTKIPLFKAKYYMLRLQTKTRRIIFDQIGWKPHDKDRQTDRQHRCNRRYAALLRNAVGSRSPNSCVPRAPLTTCKNAVMI